MSKWVRFDDVSQSYSNANKKTCTWNVYSKVDGFFLGKIKWFSSWRQYCFFPNDNTLWNAECVEDVAKFMREHKADRRVDNSD
jgi:hypothetical protein